MKQENRGGKEQTQVIGKYTESNCFSLYVS
jgi:hypothetical protein